MSTSLIHVDPYIDQNNMGGGAIVITNDDIEKAKNISLKFTKNYWDKRLEFEPELYLPEDAILDGLSKNSNVLLVETADACGGGAVGDSVQTLKKLLIADSSIFSPKPKVDGIVLEFTPHTKYNDIDMDLLEKVVKKSFSQRRKKIKTNLKDYEFELESNNIDINLRAEDISVSDYCRITRKIKQTLAN